MILCVNLVIEWGESVDASSTPVMERIIWVDSSASQVATIELTDRRV
jgi:hypothetical protein